MSIQQSGYTTTRSCLTQNCPFVALIGKFCGYCKKGGYDIEYTKALIGEKLKEIEIEKEKTRNNFLIKEWDRSGYEIEAFIVDRDMSPVVHVLYEQLDVLVGNLDVDKCERLKRKRLYLAKKSKHC